jgi:glycosyltransferase involved in cell wall biosynthesis
MSCGLPVLSTDAGGCREVLQNDNFIVPIRRDDLLAEKMSYILSLSEIERKQIGENNRLLAGKFDLNAIWEQWKYIYATIGR